MSSATTFAARYDTLLAEPRIRALYGDSGYFNVGYWVDGARELVAACDRLVDEVGSAAPPVESSPRSVSGKWEQLWVISAAAIRERARPFP